MFELAQALPAGLAEWLQFGVLGLVVMGMLVGWIVPGRVYDREQQRADRLEQENARLRHHNEDKIVPLLVRVMDVLDRSQRLDRRGNSSDG